MEILGSARFDRMEWDCAICMTDIGKACFERGLRRDLVSENITVEQREDKGSGAGGEWVWSVDKEEFVDNEGFIDKEEFVDSNEEG